jgi:hypothetical protein
MDKGEDSTKDTKEEEVNKVQKKKRIQFKPRGAPRTETESFESLTMKLSIVSSSFCFA